MAEVSSLRRNRRGGGEGRWRRPGDKTVAVSGITTVVSGRGELLIGGKSTGDPLLPFH